MRDLIVTRTPLRISFAGGGTDLPCFYEQEGGAVLSSAIDQYVYVTLKSHGTLFDEAVRLNYFDTEMVQTVDEIRNDIARECLRFLRMDPPIYISTIGDVPASSGLGSSSSFAVGLLKALHAYRGERVSAGVLAEEAARIEIDVLQRPIGKQDHYAAAYGGMHLFRFQANGAVAVEAQQFGAGAAELIFGHFMMFWTGIRRDASAVLSEQRSRTPERREQLRAMRDIAVDLSAMLRTGFDAARFGAVLDENWRLKRGLAGSITSRQIDAWYERAMSAGAYGGKLCGAGGGGFLLFVVPPERRARVCEALGELRGLPVQYETRGSVVLHPDHW